MSQSVTAFSPGRPVRFCQQSMEEHFETEDLPPQVVQCPNCLGHFQYLLRPQIELSESLVDELVYFLLAEFGVAEHGDLLPIVIHPLSPVPRNKKTFLCCLVVNFGTWIGANP